MTKKLWSINALATEFNLDRRTVALRINGIAPAGKLRGHDAWAMLDVAPLLALDSMRAAMGRLGRGDPLLDNFVDRISTRFEIQANYEASTSGIDFRDLDVDAAAGLLGVDAAAVRHWLFAGAPYRTEGDWETGEGFRVCMPHFIDWLALMRRAVVYAAAAGRERDEQGRAYAALLRLDGR